MELPVELMRMLIARFGEKTPIFTDKLYYSISEEMARMAPAEKEIFFNQVCDAYTAAKELILSLATVKPAHKRAKALHMFVDDFMKSADLSVATCKRKCHFCCHLNVDVSNDEASILRHHYKGQELKRVRKQAKVRDYDKYTQILGWEDSRCVFLQDGECSIYEDRPVACRTHYVASEPELCDPVKYPGGQVKHLFDTRIEMIKTLMYEQLGCDNIARQLLKK